MSIETIANDTDALISANDYGGFRVVSLKQGRAGFYAYKSAHDGSTVRDLNLYDVIDVTTTIGVNGGTIIAFTHADGSVTNVYSTGPEQ